MDFDVVVVGAGAAGMMCAAVAGQRGRRVLLVEHAERLAEKIRISGGGRCNFTNLHCRPEAFLSRNPHFCRSALARYTARDFIALVEKHGIAFHEKTLGQLFCDDSSAQIIAMLKAECDSAGVQWAMPVAIAGIARRPGNANAGFDVATSQGTYSCASLVIATGGLAIPKIGATPFGYRIAEQFGIAVVPPKAALVPLAAPPEWLERYGPLSGASFDTTASCDWAARKTARFREAALITHRGLSGPAILQVSSYWQMAGGKGDIELDLLPAMARDSDTAEWLAQYRHGQQPLGKLLVEFLPQRFAQAFADAHGWVRPLNELSNAVVAEMVDALRHWRIRPSGTLGYEKAEVTLGGVDTDALSQQTMAARAVPGLYFIGEVVDVTGWLGGYNFQWAWSSGHSAGLSV